MRKFINLVYDFVIGGLSIFTAFRYWLLNLNGLDLVTSVFLMLIALAGVGKVYLGWKFPIIPNAIARIFPKSKPEKCLNIVDNEDISIVFLFIKLLERMNKMLKKITQWLKLNYAPLLSFIAFVLYVLDNHFDWTDKWGLPNEWYYAITAIIIIIVGIGIKSKGFKGITLGELISEVINNFVSQKAQIKQENKDRAEEAKLKMKTQPMVDVLKNTLKDEIMKELKGEQPPIIENTPNKPSGLTREDKGRVLDEVIANERNNQ